MLSEFFSKVKSYLPFTGVFCVVYLLTALVSFSGLKHAMMMYGGQFCVADFIDTLGSGSLFNVFLIPFSVAVILLSSERHYSTMNHYIRNRKRVSILYNQLLRTFILSAVLSSIIVILSFLTAGLFTANIINWDQYDSFFFQGKGVILHIGITEILLIAILKLFFPVFFFTSLCYMITLMTKKVYAFLIVLFFSATNCIGYLKYAMNNLLVFPRDKDSYLSVSSIVLLAVLFPLMIVLVNAVSCRLIKRKDFFVT